MAEKAFTVEEANALIPQLEDLLVDLQSVRDKLLESAPALEGVLERAPGNGGSKAASEYLLLLQHFNAVHTMLTDLGCELKDLNQGLVDFRSYRNGELIYLCWKRGEPRIEYWHDLQSGFAGRQPL